MGRNNSSQSLIAGASASPLDGDIFHFRSASTLSTRSEGASDTAGSITSEGVHVARKVKSIAEFPPLGAGFVSGSSEDVSPKRRDSSARHSCCSDTSKLANDEFIGLQQSNLKFVLLGDSAIGKTSLLMSLTSDKIPELHAPTIYDKFTVSQTVYGKKLSVTWCDTAGQDDFAHLRPLCYPQVSAAVICFSVVNRDSFEHVRDKWVRELRHHCPKVPCVLVGMQSDRREAALKGPRPRSVVTRAEGLKMALSIKASTYLECSALKNSNVQTVCTEAVLAALGLGSDRPMSSPTQCGATCNIL